MSIVILCSWSLPKPTNWLEQGAVKGELCLSPGTEGHL